MKQVFEMSLVGARIAVVVLAILALVVSGAGAAARLLVEPSEPAVPVSSDVPAEPDEAVAPIEPPDIATLDDKPDPDEAPGGMATDGRPWTEQSAYWQGTTAWLGGTDQSRSRHSASGPALAAASDAAPLWRAPVHATAYQIDHRLGHRFTLLGQKPSGTS